MKPKSVSAGFNGGSFSVITDAAFTSGTNTSLISNAQIGFYSDAMGGGLFARLFNGVDHLNLSLGGPSLFTGPGATPTFLAGIFTMDAGGYSAVGLNTSNYNIPHALTGQTLVMARVVGVPEPGESMMSAMALGLAVFASKLLRDRANYRFAGNKTSSRVSARMNSSK
ncbi:hypothetical protein F183_A35440 [Bryobacterales bacterium F-183]|nr:hypothetical protein F183_A35440 [Bryobacterales bacterium F-183]